MFTALRVAQLEKAQIKREYAEKQQRIADGMRRMKNRP